MTKTASVSDRVIARKLEQQQKRMGEGGGGRGGEGRGGEGEKLLCGEKPRPKIRLRSQAKGVYDLQKLPEKSG